jgi:nitrogen fixation protein NifU and related proteins
VNHELYQQTILRHNRNPQNYGEMEVCSHFAEGFNPLCGDEIKVYVQLDQAGLISDLRFTGKGCAISQASASIMTESLKGKTLEEALEIYDQFHDMAIGKLAENDIDTLGEAGVLSGISQYPARVKCAVLSWHTFKAAAEGQQDKISTE